MTPGVPQRLSASCFRSYPDTQHPVLTFVAKLRFLPQSQTPTSSLCLFCFLAKQPRVQDRQ